jgi:hypothetical protein
LPDRAIATCVQDPSYARVDDFDKRIILRVNIDSIDINRGVLVKAADPAAYAVVNVVVSMECFQWSLFDEVFSMKSSQ